MNPTAPEAEKAIIGAVLATKGQALLEVDFLKADMFADPINREVFSLARGIYEDGGKPDVVTIGEGLRDAGIPPTVLSEYGETDDSNVVDYGRLVEGKWRIRTIIALCTD